MKNIISVVFALSLAVFCSANRAAAAAEDQECSNASINGDFGLTNTGTIVGLGDVAAVAGSPQTGKEVLSGDLLPKAGTARSHE